MRGSPFVPNRPFRLETKLGPLEDGDCLSSKEFLRRREALEAPARLELIEGIVRFDSLRISPSHESPRSLLLTCFQTYAAATPGVDFACDPTLVLDRENVAQPDGTLRILPEHGGRTRMTENDYLTGVPELVVEGVFSRGIYDVRDKLAAFRRNGVPEYVIWRFHEAKVEWFQFEKGGFVLNLPGPNNIVLSRVLPGLFLNLTALLAQETRALGNTLQSGLNKPEHSAFVERLASRKSVS